MSQAQTLTANTWPVGTEVTLLNVTWDSAYKDVVAWDSQAERDQWFDDQVANSEQVYYSKKYSYCKPGQPIALDVPYSSAYKYNYVRVKNPRQPVEGEEEPLTYFYFIVDTVMVNAKVTLATLQLDLITTYQFGLRFGQTFLEGGHWPMGFAWESFTNNTFAPDTNELFAYNRARIELTAPEGLDCGSEYAVNAKKWYFLGDDDGTTGYVIVMTTIDLFADPGTVDDPNLTMANGQIVDGLPSGCNVYLFEADYYTKFCQQLSKYSWVAQGIVSITTYPAKFPVTTIGYGHMFGDSSNVEIKLVSRSSQTNVFASYPIVDNLYQAYSEYGVQWMAKLYTYPFAVIELSGFQGNSVFLKPELFNVGSMNLQLYGTLLPPFSKVACFPVAYNMGDDSAQQGIDFTYKAIGDSGTTRIGNIYSGDFLDTALWLSDFPQFSIVNSNYLTYMASSAHTRAYQYNSAGWTLQKGNAATNLTYNQMRQTQETERYNRYGAGGTTLSALPAAMGNLGTDLTNAFTFDTGNTVMDDALTAGTGMVTEAANSALVTLAGKTASAMQQSAVYSQMSGNNAFNANQQLTASLAGQNRDMALWANQGDYENAIRGIDAAYQDAALQAPSVLGQMGGEGFNWAHGLVGVNVNFKTITGSALRRVADIFMRYGYKYGRMVNLAQQGFTAFKCMDHFSYWKTQETYLTCARANEWEKTAIRGIFEKGVTVWGNPDEIGTIDIKTNRPIYRSE